MPRRQASTYAEGQRKITHQELDPCQISNQPVLNILPRKKKSPKGTAGVQSLQSSWQQQRSQKKKKKLPVSKKLQFLSHRDAWKRKLQKIFKVHAQEMISVGSQWSKSLLLKAGLHLPENIWGLMPWAQRWHLPKRTTYCKQLLKGWFIREQNTSFTETKSNFN